MTGLTGPDRETIVYPPISVAAAPAVPVAHVRPPFESILESWSLDLQRSPAYAFTGEGAEFDELLNAARVGLWRAWRLYDVSQPWFTPAARLAIRREVRREAARMSSITTGPRFIELTHQDVAVELKVDLVSEPIKAWVRGLPEPYRELFYLLYVKGLSQREVGSAIGVSQQMVSRYSRTLLELGRAALVHLN